MAKQPALVQVEQVSDGWIKKYLLTYAMPDGSLHSYECASRKNKRAFYQALETNALRAHDPTIAPPAADAVCIVGETKTNALVLIREFRYPLNSWCIAFPAGLVDPEEDIIACANRELQEETGYAFIKEAPVHALPQAGYSSTGLTDEIVHVVFASVYKKDEAHTEPNELIEVFELPRVDVAHFLDENTLPIGTRCQLILELFCQRH